MRGSNIEVAMRLVSGVDNDRAFYSDLNGLQVGSQTKCKTESDSMESSKLAQNLGFNESISTISKSVWTK